MLDETSVDNPDLENALTAGGIPGGKTKGKKAQVEDVAPAYRIVGEKIPVSKKIGPVWKSRRDNAAMTRKPNEACWQEAIRYYLNDQSGHRNEGNDDASGNTTGRMSDNWSETENVVFENTTTMLQALYSKNPTVELTAVDQTKNDFATMCERLINRLFSGKEAPCINLKPKARRGVLTTLLTNSGWLKLTWTHKDQSSQQALNDLQKLTQEYAEAKDDRVIKEIEGKLLALEETIDLISPEGPALKVVDPRNMYRDPDSQEPDLSDCNWLMESDYLPTNYLKAKYYKQDDKGNYESLFQATHVLKQDGGNNTLEAEVNSFSLALDGNSADEGKNYGYENQDAFMQNRLTKVWWVWDRVTRRLYLFNDKDWSWPVWVWNDPYKLLRFFPYFPLHFHEAPTGPNPKGEVTYYLDQQDAINEINDETRRARRWAKRNVFFDKKVTDVKTVEDVLKGPDGTARGLDIPEGKSPNDIIFTIVPPAFKFPQLFDTSSKFQAISRLSSVGQIMRNEQFKTNTTNGAVQAYADSAAMRTDEKSDLIEDWIGELGWGLLQLCFQFMPVETVVDLIGQEVGSQWQNGDVNALRTQLGVTVTGGSTTKPNSRAKKQEAMQLGQVLGQFANASPAIIITLLKVFEQAFDEIVMKDEDWKMIIESMQAQQQKAGAGPGGDPSQGGGGQPSGAAPENEIQQVLKALPPQGRAMLEEMISKGMPPKEALQQVMQKFAPQPQQGQ